MTRRHDDLEELFQVEPETTQAIAARQAAARLIANHENPTDREAGLAHIAAIRRQLRNEPEPDPEDT